MSIQHMQHSQENLSTGVLARSDRSADTAGSTSGPANPKLKKELEAKRAKRDSLAKVKKEIAEGEELLFDMAGAEERQRQAEEEARRVAEEEAEKERAANETWKDKNARAEAAERAEWEKFWAESMNNMERTQADLGEFMNRVAADNQGNSSI